MNLLSMILVTMLCIGFASCGSDNDDNEDPNNGQPVNPDTKVNDPEGTISLSMRNSNNGKTKLDGIYIDNENFRGAYFASVGEVKGLGDVTSIPMTGWADQVSVIAGNGYVAYCNNQFYRLYVVRDIVGTSGGIIGSDIKYQKPFMGADETILLDKITLTFNSTGGSQSLVLNNSNIVLFSASSDQSWCQVEKSSSYNNFLNNSIKITVEPSSSIKTHIANVNLKTVYGKEIVIRVIREGNEHQPVTSPESLYIVGDFCGWDWAKSLKMVQCYGEANVFWHMVYINESGIMFNVEQAWCGEEIGYIGMNSISGDLAYEIINRDGKIASSNPGWYLMIVTCKVVGRDILYDVKFNKPEVWLMGYVTPNQNWSEMEEGCVFDVPTTVDGEFVSPVFANDTPANSGVRAYVKVPGYEWWKTEFMVFDGVIVYRGMGDMQDCVAGFAGQKLYLNFNDETGEIK